MVAYEWKDFYVIGITNIDEHHQHLFLLLNTLHDDFISKKKDQDLSTLFDDLVDYATYHFSAEEYWMEESSYPGLAQHANEHALFVRRVSEMLKDYHQGTAKISLEILTFLHGWLTTHILQSDAEFGCFIANSQAVSQKARK